MQISVYADAAEVGAAAAELLAAQLRRKPDSALLLPTGRTPLPMYAAFVTLAQQSRLDTGALVTFNLDEFYGLPRGHHGSYLAYMRRVLFAPLNLQDAQTHLLDSAASDPERACADYEAAIRAAGGIDVAVLGIGTNGHIGFNEPGSAFDSRTREVALRETSRVANAFMFENRLDDVPHAALTVGIGTIMEARRVVLLATGAEKAEALRAALYGTVTPDVPASILQHHPDLVVLADRSAAE